MLLDGGPWTTLHAFLYAAWEPQLEAPKASVKPLRPQREATHGKVTAGALRRPGVPGAPSDRAAPGYAAWPASIQSATANEA